MEETEWLQFFVDPSQEESGSTGEGPEGMLKGEFNESIPPPFLMPVYLDQFILSENGSSEEAATQVNPTSDKPRTSDQDVSSSSQALGQNPTSVQL